MEKCEMCPRKCGVDKKTKKGFCGAGENAQISKIMLHHWEEPVISGDEKSKGSGAIFFSHCNLKCVFCQNYEISHYDTGCEISDEKLAQIFKELENQGALNINLVTPSHYAQNILNALKIHKPKIPVVWNSGGYDDLKVIESLKGFVDVFLMDLKYFSNELALRYSGCKNYFEVCTLALKKIREICPTDEIKNGLMKKGLIIRHMILPGQIEDSKKVLEWIKENLGTQTFVSLMSQYTPHGQAKNYDEINRKLKPLEYKLVKNHLFKLGFVNGFVQDQSSASECFIPDFESDLQKNISKNTKKC